MGSPGQYGRPSSRTLQALPPSWSTSAPRVAPRLSRAHGPVPPSSGRIATLVCHTGLEPRTSRPQTGLLLTRVSLALGRETPHARRGLSLRRVQGTPSASYWLGWLTLNPSPNSNLTLALALALGPTLTLALALALTRNPPPRTGSGCPSPCCLWRPASASFTASLSG